MILKEKIEWKTTDFQKRQYLKGGGGLHFTKQVSDREGLDSDKQSKD